MTLLAAKGTAAALAVLAVAFGIWRVRSIVILLLLALTFAAAIRPGVDWLRRHRVPQPAAILAFFLVAIGAVGLFFWLAVPLALHQIGHALNESNVTPSPADSSTGVRERVLTWLEKHLHQLPTGTQLLHPVATYGHKATNAVVTIFFTLAATWYWVSERDPMIRLLSTVPFTSAVATLIDVLVLDHDPPVRPTRKARRLSPGRSP